MVEPTRKDPIEMRDIMRSATALGLGVLCAVALSLPVSADEPSTVEPSATAPAPTEPTPVDTTTPESTDVAADTVAPDTTIVGADEADDEINATVTTIAVIGFILLLAVASWWMVRRRDPDAQPMPPAHDVPPSDLI
jgi:hypothetical protein